MFAFPRFQVGSPDCALMLQGWLPPSGGALAAGFAQAGGLGVIRVPAYPEAGEMEATLGACAKEGGEGFIGLDLRGVLGAFENLSETIRRHRVSFLVHGSSPCEALRERLKEWKLPSLVRVEHPSELPAALATEGDALVLAGGFRERWAAAVADLRKPFFLENDEAPEGLNHCLGWSVPSPDSLRSAFRRAVTRWVAPPLLAEALLRAQPALPTLRIRNVELTYPILQGGMGLGVSWDRLAGSVAASGCGGIVSAIGTGYADPEAEFRQGRPLGHEHLHSVPSLQAMIRAARDRAQGKGGVGVNILCAINGYDEVVRASVAAGAQFIVSGAGLPLALPELVGSADVGLVPIVSSDRALKVICKSWERKHHRLPDAVVLEGPESGGHQGVSAEQCSDPAHRLENLLGPVLAERDKWGDFPVMVAGGVWDGEDIRRFLDMGASGVQMATRFIGTPECDAELGFKEVILRARQEDIELVKSPVGMPGRAVRTALQRNIELGEAPPVRCISNCVSPCEGGVGARKAGFCIADRLADARMGDQERGLFFTGSNGWKLREFLPVRELVAELTGDYGLSRLPV